MAALFLLLYRLRYFAVDDAFIHRRIAEHLLQTGHAYFNTGQRVMVTSSPLWTVILTAFAATGHADGLGLLLEATCLTVSCAVAWRLGIVTAKSRMVSFAAVAITFSALLQSGVEQMETPLAIALVLAGFLLLEAGSDAWLALIALAGTVRYELYLLLAIAAGIALLRRQLTWRSVAGACAILLVASSWLGTQYSTVVPNTVKAKAIGYVLTYRDTLYGVGLGRWMLAGPSLVLPVALLNQKKIRTTAAALLLFGVALCAAYVARRAFIFPWYGPLTRVPLLLGLLLGPVAVLRSWVRLLPVTVLLLLFVQTLRTTQQEVTTAVTGQAWRNRSDNFNLRVLDYLAAGRAISKACPNARLLTSEIGGLGYAFPGEVIDGFGLATPAALRWHPLKVPTQRSSGDLGAIPYEFFNETHPDVVVTYPVFSEELMRRYDPSAYTLLSFPAVRTIVVRQHPEMAVPPNEATLLVLVRDKGRCAADALQTELKRTLLLAWNGQP